MNAGRQIYPLIFLLIIISGCDEPLIDFSAVINEPPVIDIASPPDNSIFTANTIIVFEATARDPEDGDISDKIRWYVDNSYKYFLGATYSTDDLSIGSHTIKARVSDTVGWGRARYGQRINTVETTITVTIKPKSGP